MTISIADQIRDSAKALRMFGLPWMEFSPSAPDAVNAAMATAARAAGANALLEAAPVRKALEATNAAAARLEQCAEKWKPVFRESNATTRNESMLANQSSPDMLSWRPQRAGLTDSWFTLLGPNEIQQCAGSVDSGRCCFAMGP